MWIDGTEALRTLRDRSVHALATTAEILSAARDRAIVAVEVPLALLVDGFHASALFVRVILFTLFAMVEQFWWRLSIFDHLLVARDVVVDSLRAAAQAIYKCLAIVTIEAMYVVEVAMRSAGLVVTAVPLMARKSLLDLMSRAFSKARNRAKSPQQSRRFHQRSCNQLFRQRGLLR